MSKEILPFGDIEIEKNKFYLYKTPMFKNDVDIEKVLKCNKISFGRKSYKDFIGYLYNDLKVKPLHAMLPKTSAFVNYYDGKTKWIYFLIEDDDLLEKYNAIWDKVSADVKNEFYNEPIYIKDFRKPK